MRKDRCGSPADATGLEQGDDFGGEGGKRREPTAKASNDKKPPLGRDFVRVGEESDGHSNDVAANNIGH